MATPITWRNINAPDFGSTGRIAEAGNAAVQRGLGGLATLAKDINTDTTNKNTESLLAGIQGINSLEDYDAAVKSGQFNPSQFGDQVDTAKVRQALQQQDDTIRSDITTRNTFNEQQLSLTEAPKSRAINNLIASNKFDEAALAIKESGLRDTSTLSNALTNAKDDNLNKVRNEKEYQQGQALNNAVNSLITNRTVNEKEARKLQDNFSNPDAGITFDGQGQLQLDPALIGNVEADAISKQYKALQESLPKFMSDKEQIAKVRSLPGNAEQKEKMANVLKQSQLERKQLSPEQESFAKAQIDSNTITSLTNAQLEESKYQAAISELPIDITVTEQQSKIKPGDAIQAIQSKAPEETFYDTDTDAGGANLSKLLNTAIDKGYKDETGKVHQYPGWVLEEAGKKIPVNSPIWRNDGVSTDEVIKAADEIMSRFVAQDLPGGARELRENHKKTRDTNLASIALKKLENDQKAYNFAKNKDRIFNINQ